MNWYLFGGYTALWTVLFVLLVYLKKKQGRLAEDIRLLSQERRFPDEPSNAE